MRMEVDASPNSPKKPHVLGFIVCDLPPLYTRLLAEMRPTKM